MAPRYHTPIPEHLIQRAVFDHLRARSLPGVFAFAVPNGGYRRPTEAAIFKGGGVIAGIPDVIIIKSGRMYALELKRVGGKVSREQHNTMKDLTECGATCAVAYGIDAAIIQLEDWQLLRGKSPRQSVPVR
jgi:hypothetical protein